MWVNKEWRGRLKAAQVDTELIRFADLETGARATVYVPADDLGAITITVNGDLGKRTEQTLVCIDAECFNRGTGITGRDVYHFVTREHCQALRAGLTVHRSAFSSTPHRFELTPEKGFEEVFYFLIPSADEEGGDKGLLEGCGLWPDGTPVDAAWPVHHRSFAQVPMGWHRVVVLPSAEGGLPRLRYIWAYLCLKPAWEKG